MNTLHDPSTPLRFSVVICAYTEVRWDDMLAAIGSLWAQTLVPVQIILVIDHNKALYERTYAHLNHRGVQVIENSGLRGLSGARNSGMAAATSEIIAFMDEDATAATDWLAQLAKVYDNPAVMGVGGAILPSWSAGRPKWFPEEFDWVVGCTYKGMPTTQAQVRNVIGCNMSFRREVCESNGGFRDGIGRIGTLPVGCEETEYCIRANQRWPEKTIIYNPNARVFHKVPATRSTWKYFFSRTYAEGISKALIGQFVGTTSSLSSEKSYVVKTLPKGVLRGIADGLFRLDPGGFARAGAIISGFARTGIGYVTTRFKSAIKQSRWSVQPQARLQPQTAPAQSPEEQEAI